MPVPEWGYEGCQDYAGVHEGLLNAFAIATFQFKNAAVWAAVRAAVFAAVSRLHDWLQYSCWSVRSVPAEGRAEAVASDLECLFSFSCSIGCSFGCSIDCRVGCSLQR